MAYPISDVPRRIVYSGSAGVGPYAFTFEVLANTDIAVYKNTTLLTLTTDYTVTINTGTGTGTVTLVVAATGADTVTIVGDRAIQRTSDFVTGGDLFANTLNNELDAQTIYTQQVDEKADRAIRAPVTDPTTINMVLPAQATRANKALGFNSSGNPTQSSSTLAAIDAAVTTIQTLAAASPGSSAGISHIAAGSGAVATTVQSKLRELPAASDYSSLANALAANAGPVFLSANRLGGVQYATDARSKKLRTVAGVIRQTAPDAGWEFLTPTGHDKLGFSGAITVDGNGDLIINFGFTANNVISFIAVPDEFYASQGLKIGASVGLSSARLEAYADMSAVITSSGIAINGSLGLSDVVSATVDATNGTVTVTHPAVYWFGSSKASAVSLTANNGTAGKSFGGGYFLDSVTDSDFVVQRVTPLAGVVTISSSTPAIDTLCKNVTVAWDATNTCFVVTHPTVVSGDKHPVVGGMIRNPGTDTPYFYLAEFTTSTTETRVHVYNGITGAKITTAADNSMRFSFVRPDTYAKRALSATDNTQCQVFRSNIPLNFNKIFANSGNIWLYGVMEEA